MKRTMIAVCRYALKGGYFVEILPEKEEVSFWIGHNDADVKEKMFAITPELAPDDRWDTLVEENWEEFAEEFGEAWLTD